MSVKTEINGLSKQNIAQPICNFSLADLLPNTLTDIPAVSISMLDKVEAAAGLLSPHLESFVDSLVVTDGERPVGSLDGMEIMREILKNPTFDFFINTEIGKIKNVQLVIVTKHTKLSDLLNLWKETGKAFAIISNQYHGYSAISARKLLEVGSLCDTDMSVKDLPKKSIVTFQKDQPMREIIYKMYKNKTRRLILEGTSLFISDRHIIEKIATDLTFLHKTDNFLDMKASEFKLDNVKMISGEITIPEISKIMHNMHFPYVMTENRVISPWDVALILASKKLKFSSS